MSKNTLNKIELAIEQLETALQLFLSCESYVSALTLAGAAEEIFGKALEVHGIENSLQERYKIYSHPRMSWVYPDINWSKFTTHKENKVRNAVKHLKDENDFTFEADIKAEALDMLVRSIDNYKRLNFTPTKLTCDFEKWYQENIIGNSF